MSESKEHKREKNKAAGKHGKIEVPLKSGRRLDAQDKNKATEVQRNCSAEEVEKATSRLMESGKKNKDLIVPKKKVQKTKKFVGKLPIDVKPIKR